MEIRYEEWLPESYGLQGLITAYWRVWGDGSNVPSSAVLPDGHVEVVFNLGAPVGLFGPAYDGDQPHRAVVGPLSKALRLEYRGPVNTFGIRFHPARGAGFLGKLATELAEKLLPLSDVCASFDRAMAQLLLHQPGPEANAFRVALDRVLLQQLPAALPPDTAVIAIVDRLTCLNAMPPVTQIARELGISTRQLQRRFLAAVGMPPKRFVRILRFARVWQLASMSPRETWAALAAENGYADQAHLIREFHAFGAQPPTQVFTADWYDATALSRLSGPAPGVRFIQDSSRKTRVGSLEHAMKRVTLVKLFVTDQETARRFYVEQLGFQVAEDRQLGDYRWLLVRAPDNSEFSINLDLARTDDEKSLVGRQAAGQPLFSTSTDNCLRDYQDLKHRGVQFDSEPKTMPYGTGVMLRDLYGNKIYWNQDPA